MHWLACVILVLICDASRGVLPSTSGSSSSRREIFGEPKSLAETSRAKGELFAKKLYIWFILAVTENAGMIKCQSRRRSRTMAWI